MNTVFRCLIFPVFLSLSQIPGLHAQDLLDLHIKQRCIYSGGYMEEELYRFTGDAEVSNRVKEIATLADFTGPFVLIQTNVENVSAVVDGEKRYLLYSLDFVQKSYSIETIGALAHEMGHLACGHLLDDINRKNEEHEADRFMGYVLSKKGFPKPAIEAFLKKIPSSYERSVAERLKSVWEGFDRAERAMQLNSLGFDDEPKMDALTLPDFPWPPPSCNARCELPQQASASWKTLGDAERKIRLALDARGYAQRSYFSVPNGFAVVTQLEQYNSADGSIRKDRTRWFDYPAQENFSGLLGYLSALVMPQKGYFRIFVFVVTNRPFGGTSQHVSKEQATAWLSQGYNKLPRKLAETAFADDYTLTALVYEFEVPESNRKPVQKCPSPHFDALTHLVRTGIAPLLGFSKSKD